MGISRAQKDNEIKELNERFANDEIVVMTHYSGLTVAEISELRSNLRQQEASFKVTKNSLAKRAIKGTAYESLEDMFAGPTAVASSKDPVAAAKVTFDFAKDHDKLIILGGSLGGKMLSKEEVEQLAKLPSMDEIRSKLVGLLVAPQTKLAGLMQAPARELACITKAYAEKEGT